MLSSILTPARPAVKPAATTRAETDPFGGGPGNWSLANHEDTTDLDGYAHWSESLPDDPDARSAWEDEQEALALRELEEIERVGGAQPE